MRSLDAAAVRRSSIVLSVLVAIEGGAVLIFARQFLPPVFARAGTIPAAGWAAAILVACAYVVYAARRLPVLSRHLLTFNAFKLWGPLMAIPSAIVEEVFFRQSLMNAFIHQALIVQVCVSAVAFGLVHAVWAFKGGRTALVGAVGSTTVLGAALAIVFVLSGRAVLPCVIAHFLINAVLEPWLVYAYAVRADLTLTQRHAVA